MENKVTILKIGDGKFLRGGDITMTEEKNPREETGKKGDDMKKLLKMFSVIVLTSLLMLGLSGVTWAESISLEWDANTESDLAGYKIYVGTESGVYASNTDVGDVLENEMQNLIPGTTYFFVATAYDTSGNESGYSNEISTLVLDVTPPGAPTIRIVIIVQ